MEEKIERKQTSNPVQDINDARRTPRRNVRSGKGIRAIDDPKRWRRLAAHEEALSRWHS